MKFDKILEYQRIDQDLIALEGEVSKSEERKALAAAKMRLDSATETIGKLSQEASELLSAYTKMKNKIDELKAGLDEFDGIVEGVEDLSEADYYLRQISSIADEIAALEKEASRDAARIDEVNSGYKKTWEAGIKASEQYKQTRVVYDKFVEERQPKVREIKKRLDELKKDIPKEFLEAYITLRQSKKLPAFVEYNPENSTCGRCFMDVPNDTKSKLKNPGDYCECPNCRRILYIPE